ncbi:MAG: hypothetical protein ABJQ93_12115 [Luteolibacter sp.]
MSGRINQGIVLAMPEKHVYGEPGTLCAISPQTPIIMPAKKTINKVAAKKVAAKKAAVKKAPIKKAAPAPKKEAKKAAPKEAAKPVKKVATKKTAAKKAAVKKPAPSLEAIAKAAYLNYRRRMEQGLPGDNDSDWLEAERSVNEG